MKYVVTLYPAGCEELRQEIEATGPLLVVSTKGRRPELEGATVLVMPPGVPYSIVAQVAEPTYNGFVSDAELRILEHIASKGEDGARLVNAMDTALDSRNAVSLNRKGLVSYGPGRYFYVTDRGKGVLERRPKSVEKAPKSPTRPERTEQTLFLLGRERVWNMRELTNCSANADLLCDLVELNQRGLVVLTTTGVWTISNKGSDFLDELAKKEA